MISTLQGLQNSFAQSRFAALEYENYFKQEVQARRKIRSFYLMAQVVVSKVQETETVKRKSILVVDDEVHPLI